MRFIEWCELSRANSVALSALLLSPALWLAIASTKAFVVEHLMR